MKQPEKDQTKAIPKMVACPGSALGKYHECLYNLSTGIWKCEECGLAGNTNGYAQLNSLEAERHRLAIELDIKEYEQKLAEAEWTR